ncbi:MAG: protein kinase [Candidatus Obscuribacterales bacterium]
MRAAPSTTGGNYCPACGLETQSKIEFCPHDGTRTVSSPAQGEIIYDHFRFHRVIAAGGMGLVYHCENLYLSKDVAIKTLLGGVFSDEQIVRFQQEARVSGRLDHRNIVAVYDFGVSAERHPYMVMEYLPGKTLREWLEEGREFSVEEVAEIAIQICEGLLFAHDKGILHRDLKPGNILLVDTDELSIKILDFGIAKVVDDNLKAQGLTRTGVIMGSANYMSPEQGAGLPVDHRSDIYSLGCVLYELLSGRPPFLAQTSLETIQMHRNSSPETLESICPGRSFPKELTHLVETMLAKDPEGRPNSLGSIVQTLAGLVAKETSIEQPEEQIPGSKSSEKARSPIRLCLLIACLVVSAGALVFLGFKFFGPKQEISPKSRAIEFASGSYLIRPDIFMETVEKWVSEGREEISFEYSDTTRLTDEHLSLLARDKSLKTLRAGGMAGLTASHISMLEGLPIENLYLDSTDLTDDGLRVATRFPLKNLSVQGCDGVTDAGMAFISKCRTLGILSIGSTRTTREGLKLLKELPGLVGLKFGVSDPISGRPVRKLDDDDLLLLSQLVNLTTLSLRGQSKVTDAGVAHLSALKNLVEIDLSHTNVTDRCLASMDKLPRLTTLTIESCPGVSKEALRALKARKGEFFQIKDMDHEFNEL